MIKNFLQKYQTVLFTVAATSLVTSLVASGYFVMKDKEKNASQQIEVLQKSIEELQDKSKKETVEIDKEQQKEEKELIVPVATIQKDQVVKKNVEVSPAIEEVEEKVVSCLAFDGSIHRLSEDDCDLLKQANALMERAVDRYNDCISGAEEDLSSAKEEFQDRLSVGYSSSATDDYNRSIEEYNNRIQGCVDERNKQLKKLQK